MRKSIAIAIVGIILLGPLSAMAENCFLVKPCLIFKDKATMEKAWVAFGSGASKEDLTKLTLMLYAAGLVVPWNSEAKTAVVVVTRPAPSEIGYEIRPMGSSITGWVPSYAISCE